MFRSVSCLALAILMLASMFIVSCSDSGSSAAETTTAAESTTADTTAAETEIPDDLPDADFGGISFRIGCDADPTHYKLVVVSEADGDVVDDAVYSANAKVMERFDVKLDLLLADDNDGCARIKKSVLAGDDAYDLFTGHDINMGSTSIDGIFRNVRALPHLDFGKPWWPSYTVDSLTVDGVMLLFSNYISYQNLSMTRVTFINKGIAANLGVEVPYDSVRAGTWVLDDFISMTKDVYSDLNGDGERTGADLYGFATNYWLYSIQESFGIKPVIKDNDGKLTININNENTVTMIEKLHGLLYDTTGGYVIKDKKGDALNGIQMFAAGQSLMAWLALLVIPENLRESDVEYGILPIPKLDENQENYISGSTDRPYGVPVTAVNDELLGTVIEAMSAEGYKQVRPAYFETALKNKFTYDADSADMLDIIGDTIVLDFSYIYSNFSGFAWTLMNMVEPGKDSTDFASYYAKNEKAAQKQLDKVQAAFDKIASGS